jgi:predicted dehydrogenase
MRFQGKPSVMKVGIVGCGYVSGLHVNAWRDVGASVTSVCDLNEKTAMEFAEKWRIPSYHSSFSEMLQSRDFFAVSICTPPQFHANLAIEAIESGCHVVVEKPFTVTVKEAHKVLDTLHGSPARLTIIHSQLYEPSMLRATKQIKAGAIGRIAGMNVGILHSNNEPMASDRNHWCYSLPGGRFGENLPHPVYLLQAFLGKLKVKSVHANKLGSYPWMPFDELRVVLEADGKKFGTIHISFNAPGSERTDVSADIYGTGGAMRVGIYPISSLIVTKPGYGIWLAENVTHQVKIGLSYLSTMLTKHKGPRSFSATHALIIRSFVESILGNGESLITPEMGCENVLVVEQICKQIDNISASKD